MKKIMNNKKIITGLIFCLCLPLIQGCARLVAGEGAATLLDMKKDEAKKQEMLNREESNFQAIKAAAQKQGLKIGMSAREAEHMSAPTLIVREEKGWRWMYQGKGGKVLDRPKIYLFFDENYRLAKWECVRIDNGCE
ncbi:MAG TPA: hypothetical protein VJC08_00130 [bacterium]|nr:hypothetical protein [bacterium]